MTVKARILLMILWLGCQTFYAQTLQDQTSSGTVDLSDVFGQEEWWQASTSIDSKWSQQGSVFLRNRYSSFREQAFLTTNTFLPSTQEPLLVVNLSLDVQLSQYKSRMYIYAGSEQTGNWSLISALYTSHRGILRLYLPANEEEQTQLMFEYVADADVDDFISIDGISWSSEKLMQLAKSSTRIYPNPVDHRQPTFHYQVRDAGEYEILLMDMNGKKRMKTRSSLSSGTQTLRLPADLQRGNYYFQLLNLDNSVLISKPISVN